MNPETLMKSYFDFFKKKGHKLIESASLIPVNDASVLFNTAGMQPLVPYLLGQKHPSGARLVNVQKCLRTVDFENIGDDTHNTFFQMLGNWSLGDYFKKEAIEWSYEFLTKILKIPLEMLAFTVYKGDKDVPRDEESVLIWSSLGVPKERIAYVGKDNFWQAGDIGPCGPSTEMFYWTGEGKPPKIFDAEDQRWVEIWNDVFMTYDKKKDGSLVQLKQKNVDTGMGMERTLAVLSGQKSAYETDLFQPLIKKVEEISSVKYSRKKREIRIIVDHLRAAVFILGDQNGITPSNIDRGYILRRLIRRTIRFGKMIGIKKIFTPDVAKVVINEYGSYYQELKDNSTKILSELRQEEEKFAKTLENGLKEFNKMAGLTDVISGKDAFLLFQSYGFPIEMTQELALEQGITVDEAVFKEEFEKHQNLSRTATVGKFKGGLADTGEMSTKYHTATHLLHAALRKVLGTHVEQRGSNITSERLRFDFSHPEKMTDEQKKQVEDLVNVAIQKDYPVSFSEMSVEEAKAGGAMGLFEDKYGSKVKVYTVGDPKQKPEASPESPTFSKEICGGPHVEHTGVIGHFKISKEEACSSGIRRIKAIVV